MTTAHASKASPAARKARPKYYDLNLANLPVPGLVSIFHRVTGAVMFLVLVPVLLYILQQSLQSSAGYLHWKAWLGHPLAKIVLLGFVWAYLHHFFAGIRYLLLDVHWGIALVPARASAKLVLALGLLGTGVIGVLIW